MSSQEFNAGRSHGGGIGVGSIVAIVMSWTVNHSILWCIIHGFFGWLYVLYRIAGCGVKH